MQDISATGMNELRQRATAELGGGHVPSCQYALATDEKVIASETLGAAAPDSRYTILPGTKLVISSVISQLIRKGASDPADPVSTWGPGSRNHRKHQVTLEDAFLHTCGFPLCPA